MDKPLSSLDIEKFISTNIVTYNQLKRAKKIEDLFKNGSLVILYRSSKRFGHWVTIFLSKAYKKQVHNQNKLEIIPTIEFFDSYGIKPDDELLFTDYIKRIDLDQVHPILSKLLYEANLRGYDIQYNPYVFQSNDPKVATCGRHVIVRNIFKDLTIDEYKKQLTKMLKPRETYDMLVTRLTRKPTFLN